MAAVSPVEWPSGWAQQPAWSKWRREEYLPLFGNWTPGHDCTDRIIPGPTAMTVLTELSHVPRPWLYSQNYHRFHGHDCTDKIIPGRTGAMWCEKLSSCCQCQYLYMAFTHVRSVCLSVAPSRNPSCLHACIINGVGLCEWREPHVRPFDRYYRAVWRHCVHQSCLDRDRQTDSGVPKGCGWDALTFPSVT
jgi:hypothetical protein